MSIRLATKGCPGVGCQTDKSRIIYWNHSCGNKSYLDRNAKVICYSCNSSYLILEAKFKCRDCKNYRDCDKLRIGRILCALSAMEYDSVRTEICNLSRDELASFLDDVSEALYQK